MNFLEKLDALGVFWEISNTLHFIGGDCPWETLYRVKIYDCDPMVNNFVAEVSNWREVEAKHADLEKSVDEAIEKWKSNEAQVER